MLTKKIQWVEMVPDLKCFIVTIHIMIAIVDDLGTETGTTTTRGTTGGGTGVRREDMTTTTVTGAAVVIATKKN